MGPSGSLQRTTCAEGGHSVRSTGSSNVSGTKRAIGVFGAVALSAAVVLLAFGGATGKSAVTACNANAKIVETAVSMFQIEHSGVTPTRALLTSSSGKAAPILKSWPNGGVRYAITLNRGGDVMVSIPAKAAAVSYDTANPCGTAA
jgi:hypothetical protein